MFSFVIRRFEGLPHRQWKPEKILSGFHWRWGSPSKRLITKLNIDHRSCPIANKNIHLFAGRAVKRERRKGSSRRQQPAYGAAVNEVARELLRSARSPKRENGGRRYIKHDGMIASPVGSCLCCWQLPLSPPVPPLYCYAPHCPSLSLRPGLMHSKMWLCELYIICYQF